MDFQGKRVSIIIPVYNVEDYVEVCLQSVINQTVANQIECIIVDDCGTDGSMEIVAAFVSAYSSIHENKSGVAFSIVSQPKNCGLSAARNLGVQHATGEFIYFLDSDDYLIPTAIETLLQLADKHEDVDLIPALYLTDKGHRMDQFGEHSFPDYSEDQRLIKRSLLDYDCIPVTAANRLIRREFFIEHNLWFKEGIIHEDNYWTFFAAKYVKRMAFCPEKIYCYRFTEGSITKKVNVKKEAHAFKTMIADFTRNIDPIEMGAQKRLIFLYVRTMSMNGYFETAVECTKLIKEFDKHNTRLESALMWLYFSLSRVPFVNNKILNLLQRVYLR